jgi:hypothetical protein
MLPARRLLLIRGRADGRGKRWRVVGRRIATRGPPTREGRSKPTRIAGAAPTGRAININTATQAELEAPPGVGPVIARRIIEGRPYRSVDDLDRAKGISGKRLEEIRPLVAVEGAPAPPCRGAAGVGAQ